MNFCRKLVEFVQENNLVKLVHKVRVDLGARDHKAVFSIKEQNHSPPKILVLQRQYFSSQQLCVEQMEHVLPVHVAICRRSSKCFLGAYMIARMFASKHKNLFCFIHFFGSILWAVYATGTSVLAT